MNVEIAEKWVEALRSGEYVINPGHGLKTSGRHSCLGVLCEVAVKNGARIKDSYVLLCYGGDTMHELDGELFKIPKSIRKWAGMRTNPGSDWELMAFCELDPELKARCEMGEVGYSFKKIAKLIEDNAEAL